MITNPSKQSVLIVDDTATSINVLGSCLSQKYNVYIATNGKDALARVAEALPDLILLDIMMPDMDGYEVCRRLKKERSTRDIPIIFISAKAGMDDESKGLELGAVDYIKKPINFAIVKSRVDTHLSLKLARENAELLVAERTVELLRTHKSLENKTKRLEETNTALEVLLRRRDQEKFEFESEIMINVNKLVRPYLEKLEPVIENEKYKVILQAAIINLNEIVDPFARGHLASLARLTPAEMQVANFIKMGKNSQEIASFLGLSLRTIETQRSHIRKKLGLKERKSNLRNYLLSHM
jgi:CheY-like chemotaxis protein/DNA-binding CsgD family transcriptional regulator